MSVVTAGDEDLRLEGVLLGFPDHGDWTVDDLEGLPDNGLRYELLDGQLIVSPAPLPIHQRALQEIFVPLRAACPAHLEVFVAPIDYQPTRRRSFQPDVVVARRADVVDTMPLHKPLVLAVEVLSKSSRTMDREIKPRRYAESGIDHYWIFDPQNLLLAAYRRHGGRYVKVASASGDERITIEEPFPVEICPAEVANG